MNKKVIILFCVFILSRLIFINPLPVFFDSTEYLQRLANPNYFQAIISGHMPFHAGYVMLFWPVFHIFTFFNIDPASGVIVMQILFSTIAIYCLYRFLELITSKNIAIIATTIFALTPIYWITNVSIMTESTYVNFFIISLFFFALFVTKKTRLTFYLIAGLVSFGLAMLTQPLVTLWLPFLLSVVYFLKKEKVITIFVSLALIYALIVLTNSLFIALAFHVPFKDGLYQYFFGEDIKVAPNVSSLINALRFIRNIFIPTVQSSTSIILILSIISGIKIFKTNKKIFIIALLSILPSFFTYQWFDPLLYGRHGIIAGIGIALLAGIFLENKKILSYVALGYMLIASLPALALLKQPIPYLEEAEFVKTLPKGLLIETHFARPQVEGYYSGETIFVNQPEWDKQKLKETIDSYLADNRPIFVTSQALSDPYGIYSGPYLYPLSLSYTKKFELEDIGSQYLMKKHAIVDENSGLSIYKIIAKEKTKYPDIPILNRNRRRIDYFDPITQLWFFIEKARIIQSHSIIKG